MHARTAALPMLLVGASLLGCGEDSAPPNGNLAPFVVGGSEAVSPFAAGGSGSPASGGSAGAAVVREPPPDVAGKWQLHGFGDPLAVGLSLGAALPEGDYPLVGSGCYNGAPDLMQLDCGLYHAGNVCASLYGRAGGAHVSFTVSYDDPPFFYGVDAYLAFDSSRMAGTLALSPNPPAVASRMVGWIPLALLRPTCSQWGAPPPSVNDFDPSLLRGQYVLQGDAPLGWLAAGEVVSVDISRGGGIYSFTSRLGVFWNPDYRWDESSRTLFIGPVPATVPGMPVALDVHLAPGNVISDIVARTALGESGTLLPVPTATPAP